MHGNESAYIKESELFHTFQFNLKAVYDPFDSHILFNLSLSSCVYSCLPCGLQDGECFVPPPPCFCCSAVYVYFLLPYGTSFPRRWLLHQRHMAGQRGRRHGAARSLHSEKPCCTLQGLHCAGGTATPSDVVVYQHI